MGCSKEFGVSRFCSWDLQACQFWQAFVCDMSEELQTCPMGSAGLVLFGFCPFPPTLVT